jgi:hypothetical protein
MNKFEFTTLHANESVKEEAKRISSEEHKELSFGFFKKVKTLRTFSHACVVIAMIVTICFVIGCSISESDRTVLTDEQEMLKILSKYITLENDQYVLNLSEEGAVLLGISEDFYFRVLNEQENLNAIIREGLEREKTDPNYSIVFPGRQTSQKTDMYHHIRLKTGNENDNGTWTGCGSQSFDYNNSSMPGFLTFGVPQNTQKVKFVLTASTITASVRLQINKKGNGYGNVPSSNADYETITIIYNSYSEGIREMTPSKKAATWDIDLTPQYGAGTVNASYYK